MTTTGAVFRGVGRDDARPAVRPTAAGRGDRSRAPLFAALLCLLTLFSVGVLPERAGAEDSVFTSGTVIKKEVSRLGDEGKLFLTGPADPYLVESAAVAGAFALTYVFDRDIRSNLAGAHSGTLKGATDFGSLVGDPYLHIGTVALLYGVGAVADAPRYMRLGEELGEALFLADGTTLVLKESVGRGRPATGNDNSSYRPLQFKNDYDSLASMHTASSFAIAHVLATKTESLPVKILCYAAAGFVGFSRLYQEKHWASDLVLGAAIGELAGASVTRYYGAQKSGVAIAPTSIDGTPSLALVGRF